MLDISSPTPALVNYWMDVQGQLRFQGFIVVNFPLSEGLAMPRYPVLSSSSTRGQAPAKDRRAPPNSRRHSTLPFDSLASPAPGIQISPKVIRKWVKSALV